MSTGDPPWAAYRFVRDVTPSAEQHRVHLHNLAIAELLFDARNAYITEAVGITWESMSAAGRTLVIRRLETDFEAEVPAGIALKVGVRAVARSRRTVTLDEAVWRVDPTATIAVARSVHLVVRLEPPGAIELPDDVVRRFESYEGRPLPDGPTPFSPTL
ncbi:MAG: acyl-CoA thioesterase [Mycobacterium sp.]